eukprot:14745403-Alexandrium_andersonii.AAC.1
MDLIPEATGEGVQRGRKLQRVTSDPRDGVGAGVAAGSAASTKGLEGVVKVLAKMSLQNAQNMRAVRSVVITTVNMPAAHEAIVGMKAATAAFMEKAKSYKGGEEKFKAIGCPHWHSWNALVKWAGENGKQDLKAHVAEYLQIAKDSGLGVHFYAEDVKLVRVAKAYAKDRAKLEVSMESGSKAAILWKLIQGELEAQEGCRVMRGTAPPGHFEDQLQQWLERTEG